MKKILITFMSLLLILSVFGVAVNATDETTVPVTEESTADETTEPVTDEGSNDESTTDPSVDEPTTEAPAEDTNTYETKLTLKTVLSGVSLEWSCEGEADSYNVYRRKAGEKQAKLIANVTSKAYVDKTVQNNAYYKYHIESIVDSKVKGTSEGILTKYLDAPKNLKAQLNTYYDGSYKSVVLTWTKVPGATKYAVYERAAGEKEYRRCVYTGDVDNYEIHNTNIGYYRYAVVAMDGKYESGFNTNGPMSKYFPSVTHIYDVSIQNGISFKWNGVSHATGYRIYRRAGGEKYWSYLGTVGQYDTKYQDKTVTNNKYYKYIVRAVFGTVYGPYKENTPLIHYVKAPKLLAVANATDGVYIRWQTIPGLTDYCVYKRGAGGTSYGYLTTLSSRSGNKVKDTHTVPGQYYRYVVAVVSKTGHTSEYSNSLVIRHMPLGSNWSKESVLKYYNHAVYETNRNYKQFGVTHWQNLDSHNATGNSAPFTKEFKDTMTKIYIPKNDPLKGYVERSTEDTTYWEPKSIDDRDWDIVKSATIKRGSTYDTVTIVLKDITVSKKGYTNNFGLISPNHIDFGDFIQGLKNEDILYSGKHASLYKNFTIVMKVDKNGRFISGTHSCNNVTANLDLDFYNGFEIMYNTQFDTYLTYDYFKY